MFAEETTLEMSDAIIESSGQYDQCCGHAPTLAMND
jgi:hypothetical protein